MTTETKNTSRYAVRGKVGRHHLMVAALGVLLSACAQQTQLGRSFVAATVPPHEAIVLPAPGGIAIVNVVERRYSNAVEQQIALATDASVPGQNFIQAQIFGPVGSESMESSLAIPAMSDGVIAREMHQTLRGVRMTRSPLFVQNDYGPFGYAVGRSEQNDLCLYGWQRISDGASGAPFTNVGIIHLRLRVCQAGASEQDLLAAMYSFTINTVFSSKSWNPFGTPPRPDSRLGLIGQPIYPVSPAGLSTVLEPEPDRGSVAAPKRQKPVAVMDETPIRPAIPDDAPIVPSPPELNQVETTPLVPAPPSD